MKRILLLIAMLIFFGLSGVINPANAQLNILDSKAVSIEDFETGNFSQYNWQQGGVAEWSVTDASPYEGTYSAKSGLITHNQTTSISLDWEVYAQDTLSFWYKVSSENNYDYLSFYIDGSLQDEWSGIVPWTEYITVVGVGSHTFTWEYNKDISVSSNEDACWVDYITFPPEEIEANFAADTTYHCEGDAVYFYDESIGPVTEWYWVFEGATPNTSTLQNPVVGYANEGSFDVFLEVTDGVETATLYLLDYIQVGSTPNQAPTPTGIAFLCASWGNSTYSISGMGGVNSYDWMLTPPEAGSVSGSNTNVTVLWTPGYLGQAQLSVAGINYCGIGVYSNPLTITRYLPNVTLTVPGYVSISTPPFELTGGSPAGGDYSGPGVSNGMFDPAAAGLGEHSISYEYTDVNFCSNSASAILTVTEFTDINELADKSELYVYPNPNNGLFSVKVNLETGFIGDLKIINMIGKQVFELNNYQVEQNNILELDLTYLPSGIYFLNFKGQDVNILQKIIIR
ncbi:MAG: T9SS type A sorting domain-containing protein [Bacteroidales bacterium]|nr:T9SS type A sorting domain-containing protein [Bacteroidales bacterium]MCF8402494.1 T9SS type A sorting domain-containing protein [Bacteroidales bacterium]